MERGRTTPFAFRPGRLRMDGGQAELFRSPHATKGDRWPSAIGIHLSSSQLQALKRRDGITSLQRGHKLRPLVT